MIVLKINKSNFCNIRDIFTWNFDKCDNLKVTKNFCIAYRYELTIWGDWELINVCDLINKTKMLMPINF